MKSIDGGHTWEGIHLGSSDYNIIKFVDYSTGWIIGNNGNIFRTTDGGESWIDITPAIITGIKGSNAKSLYG